MKVLKPTTEEQTFYFIPKHYDFLNKIYFRDDQTNEVVVYTPTIVKENDYLKVTGVFNLVEGHFYDVSLKYDYDIWNENEDLWQTATYAWNDDKREETLSFDKFFCTAQVIDQNKHLSYSINKGVYKKDDSYNNDYIVM